ncbi:hypothetical protein [uncultured Robinsoniella sp.]|uniref:hypothetical protein n=1 Tax=uncultured Robinsoniella sp. TaxID=904190 RepID=UPI00374E284A
MKDINKKIGMYSSAVNVVAVAGFALCMLLGKSYASYFICMFIAFSFVPMIAAYCFYSSEARKTAGFTAMLFAAAYMVIILVVYFAQLTAVADGGLNDQALGIIDFQSMGLFFSYDLLGYGLMALATFFAGLTMEATTKSDKWLKRLLLIHGIFFISCLLIPMSGVFQKDMPGGDFAGVAVLEFWCMYFIPVGVLSYLHFRRK